jgi:hypothetical protein
MSTSKFAGLGARVSDTYRMPIISPLTDQPIRSKDGKSEAYIDLISADSEVGRQFDREAQQAITQKMLRGARGALGADRQEQDVRKIAALTKGWCLIDHDGNVMDVPFSEAAAIELYSEPEMAWIFRQASVAAHEVANFIRRSSSN